MKMSSPIAALVSQRLKGVRGIDNLLFVDPALHVFFSSFNSCVNIIIIYSNPSDYCLLIHP